ncbi:MAG: outer membrane beta-barrel protein [Muribaculaceae bacterium]|nr:outer membrane beta-barrel protein [Muribaculaceae bacterium]
MKKSFTVLMTAVCMLSVHAQKESQLQEVTIVASRTLNDAEGYTTTLRGTDITKGKPAADVLSFLPNISCENGIFKINGFAVSEIYIDGVKLSDLSELNNIPGEIIDKVQVKYLAGADQNSAISGGIIMITLRRPPEGGYYGSIMANADWYRSCGFGNEGIGGIINYRYKNLSVYNNIYIGKSKLKETTEQYITGSELQTFLTETTKSNSSDFRNRLSLTQQFNSGAQLGGSYFIATSCPKPSSVSMAENSLSAIYKRMNTITQEGTLKLYLPLGRKGAEMEVTADYFNRNNNEHATYISDSDMVGTTYDKNNLNLWKFKADFLYPRSRRLSWKFGVSAQWISSTFNPSVTVESDRFNVSSFPTQTNGFTPIIYASTQGIVRKIRYSAGINWQLNRISYENKNAEVKNSNNQWAINPTVQLMMPFGSIMNHAVMLSYKRTLSNIPYTAISSVIDWKDTYNYSVGNPELKAQSTDMLMAGLSLFRNKVNITAIYAHSYNQIYWQTFQDTENPDVFYTKPINISGQNMWGFGAELVEVPLSWWKFKLSGRVELTPENITVGTVYYNKIHFREYFYFNNNFTFPNGWGGMLNIDFEPTYRTLDRTYHTVYNVTGQIHKMLFNDNLQVAVEFSPIGNRRKLDRQVGMNKVSYKYTSPVQYAALSLIWNFSGGKQVNVNVIDGIQDYHETKDNR